MMMDTPKKVAVISGAARGIGKATALMLVEHVDALILMDIDEKGLFEIKKRIVEKMKGTTLAIETYSVNVTRETEVKEVFARIQDTYSRLDILINAVGGSSSGGYAGVLTEDMDLLQWQSLVTLNLTSAFLCCREAIPLMKKHGYGRIVNFSSIARHGRRDKVSTAYAASKAGVDGFTRKLAREIAPFGITCNAIASGITLTERIDEQFWRVRSDEEKRAVLDSIPLGRLSAPEEQAQVVIFLASEAASYLTGQIIEVSGGI
jgi:NAD(P)-dependent dehydrogenase (short-subunit alcohol dehydrogenase family)